MKTQSIFSTAEIAAAIGYSHNDTLKMLKRLGLKPLREIRTEKKTYRHWGKSAINGAITEAERVREEKKKKEAPVTVAPVQAELDLNAALEIPPAPEPAQPKPALDSTVINTDMALEMLATLRSIDEKLGKLLDIWK